LTPKLLGLHSHNSATIAATSIFRTALRLALALAMCASLVHSVDRIWYSVILSPSLSNRRWETF